MGCVWGATRATPKSRQEIRRILARRYSRASQKRSHRSIEGIVFRPIRDADSCYHGHRR
jgi:hypothetical protein